MKTAKIKISASLIYDAVSRVSHWVERVSVNTALQGMVFECKDGMLGVTATDGLSTDITIYMSVDADQEFRVCLPARTMLEKLSIYAKGSNEIDISVGKVVTMKCGQHTSRIHLLDIDYFPAVKRDFEGAAQNEIDSSVFIDAISKTTGTYDAKSAFPALGGIYMSNGDFVSIDGIKVALVSGVSVLDDSILVNGATCNKIAKAIDGIDKIGIFVHDGRLVVRWGWGVITATLLSFDFPDYKSIVPHDFTTNVVVPRELLLEAVNLARLEAMESQDLIILGVTKEQITLRATSNIGTHESEIKFDSMSGEDIEVGLSSTYLLEALRKIKSQNVYIHLNDPTRLVVFSDGDQYQYGVMPKYVQP